MRVGEIGRARVTISDTFGLGLSWPSCPPLPDRLTTHVGVDLKLAAPGYVAQLCAEIPDYARLDETAREQLTVHAERAVAMLVAAFREARPHTEDELAELESIGAAQVELGASSRGVLDATRLGRRRFLRHVEACLADRTVSPGEAMSLLRQAVEQFDATGMTIVDGYRRCETASRSSAKVRLVEALLGAESASEAEFVHRGRAVGWDLTLPHGLLLVTPHVADLASERSIARFVAAYATVRAEATDSPLRSNPILHAVLLVPARSEGSWKQAIALAGRLAPSHGMVVVPSAAACPAGRLSAAYADVAGYLELATRVAEDPGVLSAERLVVYRMVDEWSPAVQSLLMSGGVGRFLALPEGRRTRLAAAVWALFVCDESYTAAAERLGMTSKAIRKRMETLHSLTGLSFARAEDRLRLWLALHLLRLRSAVPDVEKGRNVNFQEGNLPFSTIDAHPSDR